MKKIGFMFFLFTFVLLSCKMTDKSISMEFQWRKSTPEAQGLDPVKLNSLVQEIKEEKTYPDVDSLLITRNGYLVVEE